MISRKFSPLSFRHCSGCVVVTAGLLAGLLSICGAEVIEERVESEKENFRVVKMAGGLEHPWAVAFLPDGRMLITERPGRMQILHEGELTEVDGLPEITALGQGGLMDVILHPDYDDNGWIYFTYAASYDDEIGTTLSRARLEGSDLVDVEQLFQMSSPGTRGLHFGSRLVFDNDGYLFMTIGDRGDRHKAQDLNAHNGSTLRLHDDGRVPQDNPFVDRTDALPEIFSYGHRNPQGMVYDSATDRVWLHEHGPRGGDELNLVQKGENYGWPRATYGEEYRGGTIGTTPDQFEGGVPPVHHWTPSIAASGMTLYEADKFPAWKGNLFVGALAMQHVRRVELDGATVVGEEELLRNTIGRIRDVRTGPDGLIYFLTDARDGGIYRIEPVD